MHVKDKKTKQKFFVLDHDCLGRECFAPGKFQHRGATGGGSSRNTGAYSNTCMNNAYHGCPSPLPEPTEDLIKLRKADGWIKQ